MRNPLLSSFLFVVCVCLACAGCGKAAPEKQQDDPRGIMDIQSIPAAARISIQGREVGMTPYKTKPVVPQMYIVKLEKDGYEPVWFPMNVEAGKTASVNIALQEMRTSAFLSSSPAGAKVLRDGIEIGTTPCVLTGLANGMHEVLLQKDGFSNQTLNWEISSGHPVRCHVQLQSNTGTLQVVSVPEDASIEIDGNPYGTTPAELKLTAGTHALLIRKDGYDDFRTNVMVKRDETAKVMADLKMTPVELSITTEPAGAKVEINGQYFGDSPCVYKAARPGVYRIRAVKDNYTGASADIRIAPGGKAECSLKLESELGSVEFFTEPGGVDVQIDGNAVGTTVSDGDKYISKKFRVDNLSQGKHTLKIVHKRARPSAKYVDTCTFEVRKGETTRIGKNLSLWVVNAKMDLKNGSSQTGRVLNFKSDPIRFEYSPGASSEYKKSDIKDLKRIPYEE